jgi:hypothetical protein
MHVVGEFRLARSEERHAAVVVAADVPVAWWRIKGLVMLTVKSKK